MTVPASTFQVYTQTNIREDLIDVIYNVDPFKTPFFNMCKKAEAKQTYHEWDTDSLAAQNLANAAVEGDNPANIALTATVRLGNYTQISIRRSRSRVPLRASSLRVARTRWATSC